MSEPRFHVGQRVRWTNGVDQPVGLITDGPFEPGVRRHPDWGGTHRHRSYVIDFDGVPAKLIGEAAIEVEEAWAPCPGEHRITHDSEWERRA